MTMSVSGRIAVAWRDPAGSWAAERVALGEPRLAAMAFGASVFLTLGRVGAEMAHPELATGETRLPWFAATIFIGLSFGVLALYAVAALIRMIARLFGGDGGWADTRLALFWSGVAAGPAILLGYLIGSTIGDRALAGLLGAGAWGLLFAPMLAAAHGFAPRWVAIICALAFAAAAASSYVR